MLVESCLLGHGIPSVSDETMLKEWPKDIPIIMVKNHELAVVDMKEFVTHRGQGKWKRHNWQDVDKGNFANYGYVTASGTVKACEILGYTLAISCGIGGICRKIKGEEICEDVKMLDKTKVPLLATGFKDMTNFDETFKYIEDHNGKYVWLRDPAQGYLFPHLDVHVKPYFDGGKGAGLFLNPIPNEKRFQDLSLMKSGFKAGEKAQDEGKFYHPAVNVFYDEKTDGESSLLQWRALLSNIEAGRNL